VQPFVPLARLRTCGRTVPDLFGAACAHLRLAHLHVVHAAVAAEVLRIGPAGATGEEQVECWATTAVPVDGCLRLLDDIVGSGRFDLATLSVALREIRSLIPAGAPAPVGG
jgi:hypothetical protein